MTDEDIKHMAFVIIHGGFHRDSGGCSCETCTKIRSSMRELQEKEFNKYLEDRGLLPNRPIIKEL